MEDILLWDETVFKDADVFELSYFPENFPHRDHSLKTISIGLKPILRGGTPLHILCLGRPSTGKTTAVLKVFQMLEKQSNKVVTVHINSQMNSTRYIIFSQIYKKIFKISPPTSGVSFKKIFTKITQELIESEKTLLVCIDDLNYLYPEKEIDKVLYTLTRSYEEYPGVKIGVIGILSESVFDYPLDPRVQSVFHPIEASFPNYTWDETYDILKDRVIRGFFNNVLSDDLLRYIIDKVDEAKDIRMGLSLLKRSGLNAEIRASRSISKEDIDAAIGRQSSTELDKVIESLGDAERALLKIIAENPDSISGEVYKEFNLRTGLNYTRFYEVLKKLSLLKAVSAVLITKGIRGRTRRISLKFSTEEVLKKL